MSFIESYKEEWKFEFENLKNELLKILPDKSIDIQHVGSTAVPNLVAKPILDIDIIINDPALLYKISERLTTIGYSNVGEQGITGRFAFSQNSAYTPMTDQKRKWQQHHLYVCYSDSLALKNHLLFRDALLNDKELVTQYSALKANLVKEEGMTKEKYWRRKTDFIISVLAGLGFQPDELIEIKNANT